MLILRGMQFLIVRLPYRDSRMARVHGYAPLLFKYLTLCDRSIQRFLALARAPKAWSQSRKERKEKTLDRITGSTGFPSCESCTSGQETPRPLGDLLLLFLNLATHSAHWANRVRLTLVSWMESGAPCGGSGLLVLLLVHGLTPVAEESAAPPERG